MWDDELGSELHMRRNLGFGELFPAIFIQLEQFRLFTPESFPLVFPPESIPPSIPPHIPPRMPLISFPLNIALSIPLSIPPVSQKRGIYGKNLFNIKSVHCISRYW